MYTLALQAANDTVTDVDRATIQKEVDQLKDQIDDNAFQSTFNGLYPLVPMDGIVTFKEITKPADIVFLVDTTGSMSSPNFFCAEQPFYFRRCIEIRWC